MIALSSRPVPAARTVAAATTVAALLASGLAGAAHAGPGDPGAPAPSGPSGSSDALVFEVAADDPADVARLDGLDVLEVGEGTASVLGDAETRRTLSQRGLTVQDTASYGATLTGEPAPAASAQRLARADAARTPERIAGNEYDTYFGGYRTVEAIEDFAHDVAQAYPDLVELVDYGDSWLKTQGRGGHDLLALRVTAGADEDGGWEAVEDPKPRYFLNGRSHAREIITDEFLQRYLTELLDGYGTDPHATRVLDGNEVWISLLHNPDGASIVEDALSEPTLRLTAAGDANPVTALADPTSRAWQRKNLNDSAYVQTSASYSTSQPGVDLNRNYGTGWGGASTSAVPAAATYKGTEAFSEPEARAHADLLTELFGTFAVGETTPAPDDRSGNYATLHSYSNYVIYPYAYATDAEVPNLDALAAQGFRQSFGNEFVTGKAGEILYDNAGNDIDWVYAELGVPAITWEIGTAASGGFFPAYTRADALWQVVGGGVRYGAEVAAAPYTQPLGPSVTSVDARRDADRGVSVAGTATDRTYGTEPSSASRRPAYQQVTDVEVAAGPSIRELGAPVAATLGGEGDTVTWRARLPLAAAGAEATQVFVRSRGTNGHWGPWNSAFVDAAQAAVEVAPRLSANAVRQRYGSPYRVTLTATVDRVDGEVPAGRVAFRSQGRLLGAAGVDSSTGRAVLRLPQLSPQRYAIEATFHPDARVADRYTGGSSAPVSVEVTPASSTVSLRQRSGRAVAGEAVRLDLRTRVSGVAVPAGRYVVRDGSRTVRTFSLPAWRQGAVTLGLRLGAGQHRLTVTFEGTDAVAPSRSAVLPVRVERR